MDTTGDERDINMAGNLPGTDNPVNGESDNDSGSTGSGTGSSSASSSEESSCSGEDGGSSSNESSSQAPIVFPEGVDTLYYTQQIEHHGKDLNVPIKKTPKLHMYYVAANPTQISPFFGTRVKCGDIFLNVNNMGVLGPQGLELPRALSLNKTYATLQMLQGRPYGSPLFAAEYYGDEASTQEMKFPFLVNQRAAESSDGKILGKVLVLKAMAKASCKRTEIIGVDSPAGTSSVIIFSRCSKQPYFTLVLLVSQDMSLSQEILSLH